MPITGAIPFQSVRRDAGRKKSSSMTKKGTLALTRQGFFMALARTLSLRATPTRWALTRQGFFMALPPADA
jgi:hypothetical protein